MKILIFALTLSTFLFSSLAFAKKKKDPTFSGNIKYRNTLFTELESENYSELEINFKYKEKIFDDLGLIVAPSVDLNQFKNADDRHYLVRTKNSGIFYKNNDFRAALGLLSHSFGLSQLFSPLNFVDTNSYWSPLSARSISSPALRLMYKTKKVRLFGSYLPRRLKNTYPGPKSPWLPTKAPGSLVSDGDTFLFPKQAAYSVGESEEIDGALKNNFVAGLRLNLKPFLTQFIYYKGVDTDPTLNLALNLTPVDVTPGSRVFQVENPIVAAPVYQTVERIGLSVRYTLPFKWRLLYEGNLSRGEPNDRQGYRESQTHTAGLEWGIPIGKTLLLGVFQAYRSKNSNASSIGLVSPFREAYLFGAEWKYKKLALEAGYFKSASLQISLVSFKTTYSLTKDIKASLAIASLSGELIELLSGLLDRDTATFGLQYSF